MKNDFILGIVHRNVPQNEDRPVDGSVVLIEKRNWYDGKSDPYTLIGVLDGDEYVEVLRKNLFYSELNNK